MNPIPYFGIRQIEQEYQQRYLERVGRVSFAALLFAASVHISIITTLVREVESSSVNLDRIIPCAGAIVCLAPFTWLLVHLHLQSPDRYSSLRGPMR